MGKKSTKFNTKTRQVKKPKSVKNSLTIQLKRLFKPYIASIKPTITALVFLLVSTYAQQFLDKLQITRQCPPESSPQGNLISGSSVISQVTTFSAKVSSFIIAGATLVEVKALELEGDVIMAGPRALVITRHAAQRMIERNLNKQKISMTVNSGKLFAYSHSKLIKIGYYNYASKIFVAVNQHHSKILTVIHQVPARYISKLIKEISKPLSLNVGEWFVFLELIFILSLGKYLSSYFILKKRLNMI